MCGDPKVKREFDDRLYDWLYNLGFKSADIASILLNPFFYSRLANALVYGPVKFLIFLTVLPYTMIPAILMKAHILAKKTASFTVNTSAAALRKVTKHLNQFYSARYLPK